MSQGIEQLLSIINEARVFLKPSIRESVPKNQQIVLIVFGKKEPYGGLKRRHGC